MKGIHSAFKMSRFSEEAIWVQSIWTPPAFIKIQNLEEKKNSLQLKIWLVSKLWRPYWWFGMFHFTLLIAMFQNIHNFKLVFKWFQNPPTIFLQYYLTCWLYIIVSVITKIWSCGGQPGTTSILSLAFKDAPTFKHSRGTPVIYLALHFHKVCVVKR